MARYRHIGSGLEVSVADGKVLDAALFEPLDGPAAQPAKPKPARKRKAKDAVIEDAAEEQAGQPAADDAEGSISSADW